MAEKDETIAKEMEEAVSEEEISEAAGAKEEAAAAEAVAGDAENAGSAGDVATEEAGDTADADDTEDADDAQAGKDTGWAERKAARKQAKQDKKTDAYKEQIAQLEDRVKRQLAEFENFRNRSEREKQSMYEIGAKSVIEKILPVIDNFERGFSMVDPEDQSDAFVEGMQRVYKQMITELESIGVKPIEAVGREFDPNLHNAVMQVESEEVESGFVAQELQKGYTYRDTVVRHSMVAVAQ